MMKIWTTSLTVREERRRKEEKAPQCKEPCKEASDSYVVNAMLDRLRRESRLCRCSRSPT
jgi:hypothetical protein